MKFDSRKYIFANVASVLMYVLFILLGIYIFTEFPPYQPGWGEGPVPSDEESQFLSLVLFYGFLWFCAFLFFVIEILIRYLFKKIVKIKLVWFKFPKPVVLLYSILFYIGLLFFLCILILAVIDSI